MVVRPLPTNEVKRNTWYFGLRCICARFLPLTEDLFCGNGTEEAFRLSVPLLVRCECGTVTETRVLEKVRTT
jgi:hypothetical protein